MKLLKHAHMKNMTLMSCGLFLSLLFFLQARSTTGAVLVVPLGPSNVIQPSPVGIPSAGMGATGMNMGVGPMGMGPTGMGAVGTGSLGMGNMGMTPMGTGVAQQPPPVVLTDSDGEKKVVGSVNPLTGTIALDADKLKGGLSGATPDDPPAPPEEDAAE
ncbi:hypothetical protein MTO96_034253 [Rhipicephalus appendiculatus]